VEEVRYLGTTLTDQNYIQEEIKNRVKSGNACYHSVQNLLSSRLLSKHTKIKLYKAIILPVVFIGVKLIFRKEHRLRVFGNRVLRNIFGSKRDEVKQKNRKLLNEELKNLYSSPNIFRLVKLRRMRWVGNVARIGKRRGLYRVLVGKR
jgi:hypothetical protein